MVIYITWLQKSKVSIILNQAWLVISNEIPSIVCIITNWNEVSLHASMALTQRDEQSNVKSFRGR